MWAGSHCTVERTTSGRSSAAWPSRNDTSGFGESSHQLMHRPKHVGSVGRDELAKWSGLIADVPSCRPQNDADDHTKRPGSSEQSSEGSGFQSTTRIGRWQSCAKQESPRAHDIPKAIATTSQSLCCNWTRRSLLVFCKQLRQAVHPVQEDESVWTSGNSLFVFLQWKISPEPRRLATITALRKKDGVRGIATGSSFRRLVQDIQHCYQQHMCTVPVLHC